jgi:hypothetical protein
MKAFKTIVATAVVIMNGLRLLRVEAEPTRLAAQKGTVGLRLGGDL